MKRGLLKTIIVIFIISPLYYADIALAAVCNVSTTPVDFGIYDVFSATPLDTIGTITVACDKKTKVEIAIGPSPNSGGFDPRQMKLTTGSDLLDYNLYTKNNYAKIWGDGTGNTDTVKKKVKNKVFQVFGRIFPIQDVSAGPYTETLIVTITW